MKPLVKFIFLLTLFLDCLAFAAPSPARLQEIKVRVDSLNIATMFDKIQVRFDIDLEGVAASRAENDGTYTIAFVPRNFNILKKSAQNFIGFHELGHIYLGHTKLDDDTRMNPEIELEADAFAAFLYMRLAAPVDQDIIDFIKDLTTQDTMPSGADRAAIIAPILNIKL